MTHPMFAGYVVAFVAKSTADIISIITGIRERGKTDLNHLHALQLLWHGKIRKPRDIMLHVLYEWMGGVL